MNLIGRNGRMVNRFNIFKLLLLLVSIFFYSSLFSAPSFAETNAANKQSIPELPSQPIWENMKPGASPSSKNKTNNQNKGFVKPPPVNNAKNVQKNNAKLVARIVPTNTIIRKGDTITFTLESNERNLKYYWISGNMKGAKSSFTVNTTQLKLGKHRVRATVTNDKRQQSHATVFFTISDTAANNTENDATDKPSSNTDPTSNGTVPTSTNSDSDPATQAESDNPGKIIELPSSPPTSPPTSDTPEKSAENRNQAFELFITPSNIQVGPNEDVLFRSNVKSADGYEFKWKFAGKRRTEETFEITSGELEPGRYQVHLTATAPDNVSVKVQATLQILSEAPDQVASTDKVAAPDLVGTAFTDLKQQLASQNLALGKVSERVIKQGEGKEDEGKQAEGFIIEQSPLAGSQILPGSVINVVIGISPIVSVPDLFGLRKNRVRQKLSLSGLIPGKIENKIDDNAIGLVLEQTPKAGSPLDRGSSVNLVVGIATPKPLTVTIQPSSTIVELGESVELTAVIVEPEVDNNLSFDWTLGDLSSADRVFKIDTSKLPVGDYRANLVVKNSNNQEVSATSIIRITAKTIPIPNVVGEATDVARTLLEKAGLKLGDIQKLPREITEETVLEQSPPAGKQIVIGSLVQLVVATPKPKEESVITLSVDANEVKVGEAVTFSLQLTPKHEGDDIHYVYTINQEKKANVQPTLQWMPDKEGIYTVVVAAFSDKGIIAKSSALTLTVKAAWEMPIAKIIPEMTVVNQGESAQFVSTSTYDLNSSLNYVWSSDTGHSSVQKQFVFDTTGITPGSYTIKLTVIDDQNKESSSSTMLVIQADVNSTSTEKGASTRGQQGSTTNPTTDPTVSSSPTIKLIASKRFINVGTKVNIKAVSDSTLASAHYYFEMGDGENADWIPTSEIEHHYDGFGAYRVRAAVKKADKIYYSDSLTIWVFSPLLFLIMGGLALLAYLFMWWWTKHIPVSKKTKHSVTRVPDSPPIKEPPVVREQQVPLKQDDNDIITEPRAAQATIQGLNEPKERTVASVIKRAILQFTLGIILSVLVIYVILKSMSLI